MKHGLAVVFFLPVVTASSLLYAQAEPAVCYLPLQPPAAFTALDSTDPAVRITSDQVSLTDNQQANFDGNVQISYRDTLLLAPKANFSSASQLMHAEGGINYFNQALQVSGTVFSANLQQNQARLDNASYRFLAQAGRGYAAALTATEQEVMLDDALFTTCPQQDNSWALHASEINIETDAGWGEARHAVFKIKDIPVLYLPYITFPVNEERRSGVLLPKFGSSQKLGVDVELPYYLNLAENYDLTLTPRYMSKRGAQLKSEFRYLTEQHQGNLQLEYLNSDNEKPDNFGARYLGHLSHLSDFTPQLRGYIDFTDVSDDAYLSELGSDYSNQSDTQLLREAALSYYGEQVHSQLRLQGFEILGNYNKAYSALPELSLSSAKPLKLLPWVDVSWQAQYAHFRNDAAVINSADRLHLEPSIRWPLITPAMELVAETSLLHTRYQQNTDQNTLLVQEETNRTLPKIQINAKLNMERELEWEDSGSLQTFEPQVQYLYIPYRDQSKIGLYDTARLQDDYYGLFRENRYSGLDRIADTNQLTIGWTTRLYDSEDTELFRVSLGQIVFLDDPKPIDNSLLDAEQPADSVLASELLWNWSKGWYLNTALQYDSSNERMVKSNVTLDYIADDKSLIQLNHRYSREVSDYEIAQVGFLATTPIDDKWKLIASYYRDINKHHMIEANFGLQYESCCWAIRVVAKRQINTNLELALNDLSQPPTFDNGIAVQFVLKGFGEGAGFSVSDMLSNGIFGYRRPYLLNN